MVLPSLDGLQVGGAKWLSSGARYDFPYALADEDHPHLDRPLSIVQVVQLVNVSGHHGVQFGVWVGIGYSWLVGWLVGWLAQVGVLSWPLSRITCLCCFLSK